MRRFYVSIGSWRSHLVRFALFLSGQPMAAAGRSMSGSGLDRVPDSEGVRGAGTPPEYATLKRGMNPIYFESPLPSGGVGGGPHSGLLAVTVRRAPFLELDRGFSGSPRVLKRCPQCGKVISDCICAYCS